MSFQTQLAELQTINKVAHLLSGSFGMNADPGRRQGTRARLRAKAFYEFPLTAGANLIIYDADPLGGTAGNALDFQATNDGTAKASLDMATETTQIDTVLAPAVGGVAGNALRVFVVAGAAAGAGKVYEDTAAGITIFALQHAVSTVTDFETLVGAATDWDVASGGTGANVFDQATDLVDSAVGSGGTPATYAVESGTPSKTHLHFTNAVTTAALAVAAINAVTTGSQVVTAAILGGGAGAHAVATGDVVAKQDLANGAASTDINGQGYSETKTGTGERTITFDDSYVDMIDCEATLQLGTPADQFANVGTYTASANTLVINIWDKSDGALADPAIGANNRINFLATFSDYSG